MCSTTVEAVLPRPLHFQSSSQFLRAVRLALRACELAYLEVRRHWAQWLPLLAGFTWADLPMGVLLVALYVVHVLHSPGWGWALRGRGQRHCRPSTNRRRRKRCDRRQWSGRWGRQLQVQRWNPQTMLRSGPRGPILRQNRSLRGMTAQLSYQLCSL